MYCETDAGTVSSDGERRASHDLLRALVFGMSIELARSPLAMGKRSIVHILGSSIDEIQDSRSFVLQEGTLEGLSA